MGVMECNTDYCEGIMCRELVAEKYMCDECQARFKDYLDEHAADIEISYPEFCKLAEKFRRHDPPYRGPRERKPAKEWMP